jgi:hypothetical protein
MPIHDLGYRAWQGRLVPQIGRFWVIAQTGIRLAWRNLWLRRLLLLSWLPVVHVGALLLVYEQILAHEQVPHGRPAETIVPWLQQIPISESRHQVWACLLYYFFRYPQLFVMIFVVGQVAPALVSQDVRTKAFLLYFSRPLARFEYVLGKMAVVWFYLALISAVPGLLLYALAVLLSPDLSVLPLTWDLPLRVLAASAVLMVPTAAVALALSSLTPETRHATFGWFALWALGWATYALLKVNTAGAADPHRWDFVSLYHTLGTVQYWVFGLKHELAGQALSLPSRASFLPAPAQVQVWPAAVEVIALTLVALAVLFRRVSSPMRI